jgi:integrase
MPKRAAVLTQRVVDGNLIAAKRPDAKIVELVDGASPGLRARFMPTGIIAWSLSVADAKGVRRRFKVGTGLTLGDARKAAERLKFEIRNGSDPTAERRSARLRTAAAREGLGTFDAVVTSYFESGPGKAKRSRTVSLRRIRQVLGRLLTKPALDLRRSEVQIEAERWPSATSSDLAIRMLRPALQWAARRDLVARDLAELDQRTSANNRTRVLSPAEIQAIWPHLDGRYGRAAKWLLYTACRRRECTGATWSEISDDAWTIPGGRRKGKGAGHTITIPLSRQAKALLAEVERGLPDALVFPNGRGMSLESWEYWSKGIQKLSGTSGWTRHDLRRTVAKGIGQLKFPPHVIGIVLGHAHTATGATAIYALDRYEEDHLAALQAWADKLEEIVRHVCVEVA